MKKFFIIFILLFSTFCFAEKYIVKTGEECYIIPQEFFDTIVVNFAGSTLEELGNTSIYKIPYKTFLQLNFVNEYVYYIYKAPKNEESIFKLNLGQNYDGFIIDESKVFYTTPIPILFHISEIANDSIIIEYTFK